MGMICSFDVRIRSGTDREAGQRLDKLLGKYLDLAPKGFIYKMLRKKNITLPLVFRSKRLHTPGRNVLSCRGVTAPVSRRYPVTYSTRDSSSSFAFCDR